MSHRRRREGASNCVEHHFTQVQTQTKLFGMHFMVWAVCYTHGQLAVLCVCITDRPYHRSAFQIRTLSECEMMFHWRMLSKTLLRAHALLRSCAHLEIAPSNTSVFERKSMAGKTTNFFERMNGPPMQLLIRCTLLQSKPEGNQSFFWLDPK